MRFISVGWVSTFVFFLGFLAAGYHAYETLREKRLDRAFLSCVENSRNSGSSWSGSSSSADCHRVYTAQIGGKYGPHSEATISLAMAKRPNFGYRY